MRYSNFIFLIKINWLITGLFISPENINAQEYEWIKETPTGKVSIWITQLEPKDSLVFELMIINGSADLIKIDPFQVNTNSVLLKNTISKAYGPKFSYVCGSGEWYSSINPKTFKRWKVNALKILSNRNAETGMNYAIHWKVGSSIGAFQARPIEFYF